MKTFFLPLIALILFSFGTTKEQVNRNELPPFIDFDDISLLELTEKTTEPDDLLKKWDLNVEGFSPAYYDKANKAFAINTIKHPTDEWGAATQKWNGNEGIYTMIFNSVCEIDGESSYKVKIDGNVVLSFTNPLIYGTENKDYKPYKIAVYDIQLKKGSVIQVEFLPHSNKLVPENNAFAFARARWRDIDFILQ